MHNHEDMGVWELTASEPSEKLALGFGTAEGRCAAFALHQKMNLFSADPQKCTSCHTLFQLIIKSFHFHSPHYSTNLSVLFPYISYICFLSIFMDADLVRISSFFLLISTHLLFSSCLCMYVDRSIYSCIDAHV